LAEALDGFFREEQVAPDELAQRGRLEGGGAIPAAWQVDPADLAVEHVWIETGRLEIRSVAIPDKDRLSFDTRSLQSREDGLDDAEVRGKLPPTRRGDLDAD